ncbi:PAS domain-containing protein [Luteibacter sahnii]|uniref:PAS domain-containing protein n=1 Tax=Luteibacter sahnii TaxID=3021977 RepID=UPI002A6A0D76|nr:PAS domain-containing protein [Luteibacter sp. PPL193]MDY1547540.1 PAS domain-containing protein [Luteibacter sp. PPL193]
MTQPISPQSASPPARLHAFASDERFRQFAEASQDILWIRNATTLRSEYLSPTFETVYGLSREEALQGKALDGWIAVIVAEDRSRVIDAVDRVRAGEHVAFDYRIRRPNDGQLRWIRNTDFPMFDEQGNVAWIGGIGQDITHFKETDERRAFLLEMTDALRPLASARSVQREATRRLGECLGVDRVFYAELDDDTTAVVRSEFRRPGVASLTGRHRLDDFGQAHRDTLVSGRWLVVENIATWDALPHAERQTFHDIHAVSLLKVPLVKDGVLVAFLGVHHGTPRRWSEGDTGLVAAVAERTWSSVERARAETARRDSDRRLKDELDATRLLQAFSTLLIPAQEPEAIYEPLMTTLMALMRADAASMQRYDEDTHSLLLLTSRGYAAESIDHWSEIDVERGSSCGRAMREGHRCVIRDVEAQEELQGTGDLIEYRRCGLRSVQSTPLMGRGGELLGMISTSWRQPHAPSAEDLRRLDVLARMTADLLERHRDDAARRESDERLRQFAEASSDVLWIRDAVTREWRYVSPAFETIYGLGRKEALQGDMDRTWLDLVLPGDRPHAEDAIARVRRGEYVTFDYRIRRPDGNVRWIRDRDFPLRDARGRVGLIGGIGHDLTELREAERRLQTLLEGIPPLVWRSLEGGHWTWSSPQWGAYTGLTSMASAALGWLDAIHPADRDATRAAWASAATTGRLDMELRIGHVGDQGYRWFQMRATPVHDDAGATVEWLGTFTDVHELRELQERQRILVAELQHRTRNVMAIVGALSYNTLAASADLDDFRVRFEDRLDALARVQALLSRLNEQDRLAFDELLHSELDAIGGMRQGISLDGPADVWLRSSTVQILAMAIHELATNAVKYGALGQSAARLDIRWAVRDEHGVPWLHIDWRETGVHMPGPTASVAGAGQGQGRELIEHALPYQLLARTTYVFDADGVHCTIALPISRRTALPAAG